MSYTIGVRVLQYGIAGRFAMRGEIDVLPLDDEKLLADASPVTPGSKVSVEAATLAARHTQRARS